jgi:hypothetical protein
VASGKLAMQTSSDAEDAPETLYNDANEQLVIEDLT